MIEIAIVPTTEVMGVVGRSAATAVDCLPLGHAGQIELIAQELVLEDNIYSPEKVARHGFTYESVGGHVISMESYLLPERKSIQVECGRANSCVHTARQRLRKGTRKSVFFRACQQRHRKF